MNIKREQTIELTVDDVKQAIIEYVHRSGCGSAGKDNIVFNISKREPGSSVNVREFNGVTIKYEIL